MPFGKVRLFDLNTSHKILFFERVANSLGVDGCVSDGGELALKLDGSISLASDDKSNKIVTIMGGKPRRTASMVFLHR